MKSRTLYVDKVGQAGWRVIAAAYKDGKATKSQVPKLAYPELGFRPDMSLEQARERAKQINAQNSLERKQADTVVKVAARVAADQLSHSVFVPPEINAGFLDWMSENIGSKKAPSHWAEVKKMVIKLQLNPDAFFDNKKKIYKYMQTQTYSPDYVKKLLRILNAWGKFMCRYLGKYYEKVPGPVGHDREAINDAYLDSDSYYGPSEPLQPASLMLLKDKLKPEQYNWLFISVHFGLRPSEIDAIISDRANKVWRVEPGDTDILWVYQAKLTSKPRAQRWKPIPILYPEQVEALKFIYEGCAAKPLTKTLKKYLGTHTTLYGGRKGFTDLMLDRGQRLEDVAQWLGHSSIEMTWTRYKDKSRVRFKVNKES